MGVSPASTFCLPLREQTIPTIAQPTETIVERPTEMTSRPTGDEREHEPGHGLPVVRHRLLADSPTPGGGA